MKHESDPIHEVERIFVARLRDLLRSLLAWVAAKIKLLRGEPGASVIEAAAREQTRGVLVDIFAASNLAGRAQVLRELVDAAREAGAVSPVEAQRVGKVLQGRGKVRMPSTVPSSAPPTEREAAKLLTERGPDIATLVEVQVGPGELAGMVQPVPPTPAIESVIKRVPVLADTADEVAEFYNRSSDVFAAVRLTDEAMGLRVRNEIAKLVSEGVGPAEAADVIATMTGWATSYAETVFVTNAATAYTAGVLDEMRQPGVSTIMLALETIGPDDAMTRRGRAKDNGENHKAGIGLVASPDDPVWRRAMTPWGYGCRHTVRAVSIYELERRGLLGPGDTVVRYEPPGFGSFAPHPRFVGTGLL